MELKNIFKMTKTDRYTQDGRDELAKLQETEDVKYKTGDISQKTGLQKQPDGSWAPPKGGGAAPKMGSPEYNEKYGLTKRDVATGKEVDRIYEKQQNRIKELKAKGYTDEQIENDKIYQQTKEDMRNVGKNKPDAAKEIAEHREAAQYYKRKARSFSETDPSYSTYMKKAEEYENKAKELEGNKSAAGGEKAAEKHPPMVMPKGMHPAEFMKAWEDDAKKHGFKKGQGNEWREHLRNEESKPAEKSEGGLERRDYRAAMERNPTSGFDFKAAVSHSIPTNQTDYDELQGLSKFMNEEKATYQNALKSRAQALVDGHKSNGDWYPEKEQSIMKIAKAVGFDEELHKFIEEENRGYDLGYSEDAAPKIRELTGDTRIRVKK